MKRLDQLAGAIVEPIVPYREPPEIAVERDLEYPLESRELIATVCDEMIAQLASVAGVHPEIVADCVMHQKQLATNFLVLFEQKGVESELVTPTCRRQSGRTGSNDHDVVHRCSSPQRYAENKVGSATLMRAKSLTYRKAFC